MSRREFSREVKRAAWQRSGGRCEAVGRHYGWPARRRCDALLARGVEYDHFDPDGNGGGPTLENCRAVCPPCHRWKTSHRDVPMLAKVDRLADKNAGIRQRRGAPLPGSRASG